METKQLKPVLVLDCHRGIYFGRLVKHDLKLKTVWLERMRHCWSFAANVGPDKGVYSLATVGPAAGSRIGPEVTAIVHDVSKVVDVTASAVKAWETAVWNI